MTGRRAARLKRLHRAGQDTPRFDDVKCARCGRRRHVDDTELTEMTMGVLGPQFVRLCKENCGDD